MASAYLVQIPSGVIAPTLQDGIDAVVVYANDSTDAIALAKAACGADANAQWGSATVTAIAAAANWIGYKFYVKQTNASGVVVQEKSLTATGSGQDTLDEIGAALATLLGGTYNSTTQVVQIASSGSGDHSLEVYCYPPAAWGQDAPIPGVIGTLTHNGSSGSALSFALAADAYAIPTGIACVKFRR